MGPPLCLPPWCWLLGPASASLSQEVSCTPDISDPASSLFWTCPLSQRARQHPHSHAESGEELQWPLAHCARQLPLLMLMMLCCAGPRSACQLPSALQSSTDGCVADRGPHLCAHIMITCRSCLYAHLSLLPGLEQHLQHLSACFKCIKLCKCSYGSVSLACIAPHNQRSWTWHRHRHLGRT